MTINVPSRALIRDVLLVLLSATAAAAAIYVLVTHADQAIENEVNLPFGLFTLSVVCALLSADGLLKRFKRREEAPKAAVAVEWHALSWEDIHARLTPEHQQAVFSVTPHASMATYMPATPWQAARTGLFSADAAHRLEVAGPNRDPSAQPSQQQHRGLRGCGAALRAIVLLLLNEIHEPLQQLLLAVAVAYSFVGESGEAALAVCAVAAMSVIEVLSERRAKSAAARLTTSVPKLARVVRDGTVVQLDASGVVPGDTLILRAGDEVPADGRLLQAAANLQADESKLTGESLGTDKYGMEALAADTPLAERRNMLFAGSSILRGSAAILVVATGHGTELGKLHTQVRRARARQKRTNLEGVLRRAAGVLSWACLCGSVVGALLGLVRGAAWQDILLTALALAFATIPEELPLLVSAVLAIGAQRLTPFGVYVRRLRTLEALAHVDVLLSDKTGTLTHNKLKLTGALVASTPTTDGVVPGEAAWHVDMLPAERLRGVDSAPRSVRELLRQWRVMAADPLTRMQAPVAGTPADAETAPVAAAMATSTGSSDGSVAVVLNPMLVNAAPCKSNGSGSGTRADPFDAAVAAAFPHYSTAAASNSAGVGGGQPATDAQVLLDFPFDSAIKYAARVVEAGGNGNGNGDGSGVKPLLILKGAPEEVLARCATAMVVGAATTAELSLDSTASTGMSSPRNSAARVQGVRTSAARSRGESLAGGPEGASSSSSSSSSRTLRQALLRRMDKAAAGGERMVALAVMPDVVPEAVRFLHQLPPVASFLGCFAFADTVRDEAAEAVRSCQMAGITVKLVTGDHPVAAAAVAAKTHILVESGAGAAASSAVGLAVNTEADSAAARRLSTDSRSVIHCGKAASALTDASIPAHLADPLLARGGDSQRDATEAPPPPAWALAAAALQTPVFSRATPTNKLELVRAFKTLGRVVAVVGDGSNDAPALAEAHVGIAAEGATDVAVEAAGMAVLTAPGAPGSGMQAVVAAIRESRRLYDNLIHALAFYLSAKLGLVLLYVVGVLWHAFPLAPAQLIILEVSIDLGASMCYLAEPADPNIMERPPRSRNARLFDGPLLLRIVAGGCSTAVCVLAAMAYGLYVTPTDTSQSMAFASWLLGHYFLAVNQRSAESLLLGKGVLSNPYFFVWGAVIAAAAAAIARAPGSEAALHFAHLSGADWGAAVGISLASMFWMEAAKFGVDIARAAKCCMRRQGGRGQSDRLIPMPALVAAAATAGAAAVLQM